QEDVPPVDGNERREDSCGISGTGETPQVLWHRGGSPPAPRKAKRLEWTSTIFAHKIKRTADFSLSS
ncbi:hypothetical protein ACP9MY_15610, partial [Pseudobacillus badius]